MTHSILNLRKEAFQKQIGRCYYCGIPMWQKDQESFAIRNSISIAEAAKCKCTAEHLVPRSEGGKDCKSNIVAACQFCNLRRHRRKSPPDPPEYKNDILQRLKKGKWHVKPLLKLLSEQEL